VNVRKYESEEDGTNEPTNDLYILGLTDY